MGQHSILRYCNFDAHTQLLLEAENLAAKDSFV